MTIKIVIISLLIIPILAFAQSQTALPNAGLTPESPFYFIDTLGEALREFFTFNPEGKARLQITFAAERVAEIKIILETKGVEAKGLEVAQSRLQVNIAKAAAIVNDQKSKGEDVSNLAKELDEKLEAPKSALADSFKAEKRALEAKEDELKAQSKAAHRAGDTVKEEALAKQLGQVKAQKELLKFKKEDIDGELEAEEEKIEEEIEAEEKAEKAIREAEEEKQEMIDEAAEEGVELPAHAFVEFGGLLVQAKSTLQAGSFIEAKNLAKQAEKSLDPVEKIIEELEKKQEEKEEKVKEAEDQEQERIEKEGEKKRGRLGEERERIEEEHQRAEEKQREAEERVDETQKNDEASQEKQFDALDKELLEVKAQGSNLSPSHYDRITADLEALEKKGYSKQEIDKLRVIALDLAPHLMDKKTLAKKDEEVLKPAPISTPSIEEKPVLKNLIVEIEPYDKSLGRAGAIIFEPGDTLTFATFGEVVQGPEGAKTLPTFEYHTVPTAAISAAADGVVMQVQLNSGLNDYEILITPNTDSYWQVWYDHVQNVSVKKGDPVTAGQTLGTAGVRSQTAGRTELMVRYSNWRMKETYTICPFSVFDPSLSSSYQNKISRLMQDWENFKGNANIYHQGTHLYPGCQQEKIEE